MKRPKFTIRRLLFFVLLTAAYCGAWEATKREAVRGRVWRTFGSSPIPFVIQSDNFAYFNPTNHPKYNYDFWFLGLVEFRLFQSNHTILAPLEGNAP